MNYDRIILDLINRVSALEDEVEILKKEKILFEENPNANGLNETSTSNGRDKTKYVFNGAKYGKNRLVLSVVKMYSESNQGISAKALMSTFDKSLQGSLGVVRTLSDVKQNYSDYERRFFCRPNEVIGTTTENCVVCSQWGTFNIKNFIIRAKELGFEIKEM